MTSISNMAIPRRFPNKDKFDESEVSANIQSANGEAKLAEKEGGKEGGDHQNQLANALPNKLIENVLPEFFFPPSKLETLMDQEAELSKPVENESLSDAIVRNFKLEQVRNKIEQEVVKTLERQLLNSSLGEDGSLSRQDLESLAGGFLVPKDVQLAAQYMLDHPTKLDELEGPDSTISIAGHDVTIADNSITLNDTHNRLNELGDADNNVQDPDIPSDYNPPSDTTLADTYFTDTPNLNPDLYSNQQDAVAEAIRTGEPVSFTNSDGQVITVTITKLPSTDGKTVNYRVEMSDGETFTVASQIGMADTIETIANVIEWGSTANFAEGVRRFPDQLKLFTNEDAGGAGASYSPDGNIMNFFKSNLVDEELYYHELAHGIGYDLNSDSAVETGGQRFVPDGYENVLAAADADGIGGVSQYANTNDSQDFAESVAAYMNARENGPEALAAFKQAFPHRSAYIEKKVFGQRSISDFFLVSPVLVRSGQ